MQNFVLETQLHSAENRHKNDVDKHKHKIIVSVYIQEKPRCNYTLIRYSLVLVRIKIFLILKKFKTFGAFRLITTRKKLLKI